uniref:Uncharacterized protein n=1 Tax=Anguilla anguilla TaxID=7936 RepID=A0A0E9WGN3_ANGAN
MRLFAMYYGPEPFGGMWTDRCVRKSGEAPAGVKPL